MKLVHNNPETEARREPVLRRLRETPLGLRVIVNDFHPNLTKTTSGVLSVILINLWTWGRGAPQASLFYNQSAL